MRFFPPLSFMDPTILSRPDKSTLPQQTLMELLVAEFDDKEAFRDSDGYFTDIIEWEGVTVDKSSEVTEINWEKDVGFALFSDDEEYDGPTYEGHLKPGGSIDLSLVPSTVIDLMIPNLKLHGIIDTFLLPRFLSTLDCDSNNFRGTFETKGLPSTLDSLYLTRNQLSGTLDVAGLPRELGVIVATRNAFTGTNSFRDLPEELRYASFAHNQFCGPMELSVLPRTLTHLRIEGNTFDVPKVLIVTPKALGACVLSKHGLDEVMTTEGVKLKTERHFNDTDIRIAWPNETR